MSGGIPIEHVLNANPTWLRYNVARQPAFDALKDSLVSAGQLAPILMDSTFRVIDGTRRVQALAELGVGEVHGVATDDWPTIRRHLVESGQRHDGGATFLPKSYMDMVNILPVLADLCRASRRNNKGPRKNTEEYVLMGSIGTSVEAFGYSLYEVKIFSQIALRMKQILNDRGLDEWKKARDLVMNYPPGQPLRAMATQVDAILAGRAFTRRPAPPEPLSADAQKRIFDRFFASLSGAIAALPDPRTIDPNHSAEDLERWFASFTPLTSAATRLRKKFRQTLEEKTNAAT